MNSKRLVRMICAIGLFWILTCWPANTTVSRAIAAQSGELPKGAKIVVADRVLAGPFSLGQQHGNRTFLPAASIARALGDAVTVDPAARSVRVHRQTGIVADFIAQRKQILENGS